MRVVRDEALLFIELTNNIFFNPKQFFLLYKFLIGQLSS